MNTFYLKCLATLSCVLMITITYGQDEHLFKSYGGGSGKCHGRAMISYQFDTIEEQIVKRPAYKYMKEIPPRYETITDRIMVEPAHTRYEMIPPVFETTTEKIKIKDADAYMSTPKAPSVDDVYETRMIEVEQSPAYQRWEKTKKKKDCRSKNEEDCLEWQLVNINAKIVQVPVKVQKPSNSVAQAQSIIKSQEEYITVIKKKLVKPAEYKKVEVPAKYQTVTSYKLVESRRFEQVVVPAEYETVKKIITLRDGGVMEAREVLCEDEYPFYVPLIQTKLKQLGYYNDALDGRLGKKTKAAIIRYQQDKSLPIGQLDYQTIKMLGLIK